jgi:hypothetical protein
MSAFLSITSLPTSAGIGLRSEHYRAVLDDRPELAWFEVHSENYFGAGGWPLAVLEEVRTDYALSLHGVGLSLGSTDPLSHHHLTQLKRLADRFQPALISEHLSWSSIQGRYFNDLLPLPYTHEALVHVVSRIQATQEFLGRQILIENLSSYLEFEISDMPEWDFVVEVARRAGCALLLDVNNIYVSSVNHGFDARRYISSIPSEIVEEIHLAGYTRKTFADGEILIDTHNQLISQEVWGLYDFALAHLGPKPTLIEWDTDLPDFTVLMQEAERAEGFLLPHRNHEHARAA